MNILIIVENLPVPFDRRVWQEALTLKSAGHSVSVLCPAMKTYQTRYEVLDGIHIYRHPLPLEGDGALGYLIEYSSALCFQFILSCKILAEQGFDVIHACNPPDNIFLIGGFFKLFFGKKFIFDHHDINPELYVAKFGKKDLFYHLMCLWERWTFKTADISIATNESYKRIAIERGNMAPKDVYIVRSGPDLNRVKIRRPNNKWKNDRRFLVGYVGVMGGQEGLDYLLYGIRYLVNEKQRTDIQFIIVGDGTERDALISLSKRLDIADYVTFTGRVPDPILMEILCTADVCVNPDVVNEMNDKSTMNKIMEYMALGKPIVQFEMTEGHYSARQASLYARPNDSKSLMDNVVKVIDHPGLARKMGDFGKERIRSKLQWKFEKPKLLAAYSRVAKKTHSGKKALRN